MFMVVYDKEYDDFLKALSFYADKMSVKVLAGKYKCAPNHIYQIINRAKNAGRQTQKTVAKACGFETVSEFVASIKQDDESIVKIKDPEVWLHYQIIQKFKNKNLARIANEHLLELEELDPIAFGDIVSAIRQKIKEIKGERGSQKNGTTGE